MNETNTTEVTPSAPADNPVPADPALAGLKAALEDRTREVEELKTRLAGGEQDVRRLEGSLKDAVDGYRELLVQFNPGLPEELITGENIREIRSSLEYARSIAQRIKQELENEFARHQVPSGAPLRTDDAAPLTARAKIQMALGGN